MQTRTLRNGSRLRRDIAAWAIMIPSIILFLFYVWEPLAESIRLSFYTAQGFRTIKFVGFQNYRQMIIHPDFTASVANSFTYTALSLAIGFLVPLIMAVAINEVVYGKNLARTSIYLPNIVPGLVTVLIWRFIFSSDKSGGLNMLLDSLGLPGGTYLSNPALVKPVIVLTMTWKSAGATTLIYLAGLQSIDAEHYEAAIIDGAGIWRRMRHITLPNLFNLARTLMILQIIAVFQILYEPILMTNGGPNNASISMMQVVYRYAFEHIDYPHAAAMSVIISIILIALTLLYNKISKPLDA